MEDQLRAKLLQRALGERLGVQSNAERHLPAQIVGRTSRRLLVRDAFIGLQHQGRGEQARRHARPAPALPIEVGEPLVSKQVVALARQPAVEGVLSHQVDVARVHLADAALGTPSAEHAPLLC